LDNERGLVLVIAQGEFGRDLREELITNAWTPAAENQYKKLFHVG